MRRAVRLSGGRARRAVARRAAADEDAGLSAADSRRLFVWRDARLCRDRGGAARDVCRRDQPGILSRHRDQAAAVSSGRTHGDQDAQRVGYDLAPYPRRRCRGWCCRETSTSVRANGTKAFVAATARRDSSGCRASAMASACRRDGRRSSSKRIARWWTPGTRAGAAIESAQCRRSRARRSAGGVSDNAAGHAHVNVNATVNAAVNVDTRRPRDRHDRRRRLGLARQTDRREHRRGGRPRGRLEQPRLLLEGAHARRSRARSRAHHQSLHGGLAQDARCGSSATRLAPMWRRFW